MEPLVQLSPFDGTQLCVDSDPEIFFPEDYTYKNREVIDEAKSICGDCWMQKACLDYSMQDPDLEGIWGGTTPLERKRLRKLSLSTK
jgi:WhiB family redox-sensing transcriptional regulator